jgi:hypothetical protein
MSWYSEKETLEFNVIVSLEAARSVRQHTEGSGSVKASRTPAARACAAVHQRQASEKPLTKADLCAAKAKVGLSSQADISFGRMQAPGAGKCNAPRAHDADPGIVTRATRLRRIEIMS